MSRPTWCATWRRAAGWIPNASSNARRYAAWRSRPKWPTWRSSWPRARPLTSPDTPWWPTAAGAATATSDCPDAQKHSGDSFMATYQPLEPQAPWRQLTADASDWQQADPALLGTMLTQLHWIRAFEEAVLELAAEGLVHGPAHSSVGQEGGAVGSVLALTAEDTVNGSHRGHHQFLAKVLSYLAPKGFNPTEDVDDDVRAVLLRTLAEICGLDRGFSHGRGGSMHLQWKEAGAIGTNAIVGGGVPLAAGSAWAHQFAGTDAVAVTYFGDGASNIGSTLETFNLAAAWKLPICFFIENNQYAVSTNVT